jgi:PEP-CTERM motif
MRTAVYSLVAVVALAGLPAAQAGTFSSWAKSGQSSLISGGNTVRLVSDTPGQAGAAWAPGSIDLSSIMSNQANYTEVLFSFKVSGASPSASFKDGFSMMLSSGDVPVFKSSFLGLSQFDDGIAFAVDPAAGKATSLDVGSVATASTMLGASPVVSGLNMLDSTQVDAKLRMSYSTVYNSWVMTLKMRDSGATSLWKQVAFAQYGAGTFTNPADVRVGFGASTLNGGSANFDIVAFQASAMAISPVPEPGMAALCLVGLGLFARVRRTPSQRAASA